MTTITAFRRRGRSRTTVIVIGGVALILALLIVSLSLGATNLAPDRILATLTGSGTSTEQFVVFELRLPRILGALLSGTAFAVAGAAFQSVLRNPLASTDVLGISTGASLGAVASIAIFGGALTQLSALGVALLVGAAIWFLSWRKGLHGIRFILCGIALAYLCSALISWIIAGVQLRTAVLALHWTIGSVGDVRGEGLALLLIAVPLLTLWLWLRARQFSPLSLSDDAAQGVGLNLNRARIEILVFAIVLCAIATSVTGPIAFLALVAPAIARSLIGRGNPALGVSALCGGVLTLGADLAGQYAIPGISFPVGIVTGLIGAPYLLWLLARK